MRIRIDNAEYRTRDIHLCMDWRAVRFDWNHARAFAVVAGEGSFSAAARALGTSQPTIGRQVAALEEELGVTLFERVGKGLVITAAGAELVEHVRAMTDAATRVSRVATGAFAGARGQRVHHGERADRCLRLAESGPAAAPRAPGHRDRDRGVQRDAGSEAA
jgi:DNA-binding transcriptional LysR family regulator